MKFFLSTFVLLAFINGCQPANQSESTVSVQPQEGNALQAKTEDDFSDLKEKDESCDTEEDLEKKIEEQAKKQEAFKLQGGDGGCEVN